MPNYSNGKIYTIRCRADPSIVYVGSTIQSLAVRLGGHKSDTNCSLYQYIHTTYNGMWNDFYIELFELYSCQSKEELNKKEGEIIRDFQRNDNYQIINRCIAGRNYNEYCSDNKEAIAKYRKQYREENLDQIKSKKQEYYTKNQEEIKQKSKQYRELRAQKIVCECGCELYSINLKRHLKTKGHMKTMNLI